MKNPKENTIKYLVAIGAYDDACKLLGWEFDYSRWIMIPVVREKTAVRHAQKYGFDLDLDWNHRGSKGWWIRINKN